MKGSWIAYSETELDWIETNAALPCRELHAAFCSRFGRHDVSMVNLVSLRKRKGWRTGRTGQFGKGSVPANKGQKMPYNANSAATRFKKGNRTGRANANYRTIGTERLAKGGYLQRKIHDGMPFQSRWRFVHLINWEAANGPIPKGMALKCLDGNRLNTEPANWEAIARALLRRLAGGNGRGRRLIAYDDAPDEIRPVILSVAKLQHAIRQKGGAP